jgi:hypothetical protein
VCLHAVAVELHLVRPVVADGHCLGRNGAAGRNETELGHASGCSVIAPAEQLALVAFRAVPMARCFTDEPDGHHPVATLADLRRVTPWLWVHCERCQHRSPVALVSLIIRWSAEASSDVLHRSARCTRCGRKGATIQIPMGWTAGTSMRVAGDNPRLAPPKPTWPAGTGAP